jgi:hypothetical protein
MTEGTCYSLRYEYDLTTPPPTDIYKKLGTLIERDSFGTRGWAWGKIKTKPLLWRALQIVFCDFTGRGGGDKNSPNYIYLF